MSCDRDADGPRSLEDLQQSENDEDEAGKL